MTNPNQSIYEQHSREFLEASLHAQWRELPEIKAEFQTFEAFCAYKRAEWDGRSNIYTKKNA